MSGHRYLAAAALAAVLAVPATATADKYPNGCVSCHTEKPGMPDRRIDTLLRAVGHHYIKTVKDVPGDCYNCHAPLDDKDYLPYYPDFGTLVHSIHYDVPATNTFVSIYGGECRGCHSMDLETGDVSVKGGPKNW